MDVVCDIKNETSQRAFMILSKKVHNLVDIESSGFHENIFKEIDNLKSRSFIKRTLKCIQLSLLTSLCFDIMFFGNRSIFGFRNFNKPTTLHSQRTKNI